VPYEANQRLVGALEFDAADGEGSSRNSHKAYENLAIDGGGN